MASGDPLFQQQLQELSEIFSEHSRTKLEELLKEYTGKEDAVNLVTEIILNQQDQEDVEEDADILALAADYVEEEEEEEDEEEERPRKKSRNWEEYDQSQVSKRRIGGGMVELTSSSRIEGVRGRSTLLSSSQEYWESLGGNTSSFISSSSSSSSMFPLGGGNSGEEGDLRSLKEIFPNEDESLLRWCLSESRNNLKGVGTTTRTRTIKPNVVEAATSLVLQHKLGGSVEDVNQLLTSEGVKGFNLNPIASIGDDDEEEEEEDQDFDPDNDSEVDEEDKEAEEELENQEGEEEEEEEGEDETLPDPLRSQACPDAPIIPNWDEIERLVGVTPSSSSSSVFPSYSVTSNSTSTSTSTTSKTVLTTKEKENFEGEEDTTTTTITATMTITQKVTNEADE